MAVLLVSALGFHLQAGCGPQLPSLRSSRSPLCLDVGSPFDQFMYQLSYEAAVQLQSLSHTLADEVRSRLVEAYEPTTRLVERVSQVPAVAKLTAGVGSGVEAATPAVRTSIDTVAPVLKSGLDAAAPVFRTGLEMAGKELATGVRALIPVVRSGLESAGKELASDIEAAIPIVRSNVEAAIPVVRAGVQSAATATVSGFLAGFGIEYDEIARSLLLATADAAGGSLGATVEVSSPGLTAGVTAATEALATAPVSTAAVEVAAQVLPSGAGLSGQALSTSLQAAADCACPCAQQSSQVLSLAALSSQVLSVAAQTTAPDVASAMGSAAPSIGSAAAGADETLVLAAQVVTPVVNVALD